MSEPKETHYFQKPHLVFLVTLGTVVIAELLVMFLLPYFQDFMPIEEAFLDASLLSILIVPLLYFLLLRPLKKNITARMKSENEYKKILEINRIKNEFISIASHELSTPLASIMGYSELLLMEDQFDDNHRKEFTTIINQKATVMERLIDDLLELVHLEQGRPMRIQKSQEDIVVMIESILDYYRNKYPRRLFDLQLQTGPALLSFDQVRISQVFHNLLSNSIKFSSAESPIEVQGILGAKDFTIRISDRGIGMSPEEMSQVFAKFYRADHSDTAPGGLGLGMTIAKIIIEAHGGKIWLESMKGEGTTVSFVLPIDEQPLS